MSTSSTATRSRRSRVRGDAYVDSQLRRTSSQVRKVDLTVGLLMIGSGALLFLLGATLLEHWILPGGLGVVGRWIAALLLAAGVTGAFIRWIWPSVWRAINPAYAAQTIEQSAPGLKNVLLNLLDLRRSNRPLPAAVYQAVEAEAAGKLAQTRIDLAVDRTNVLKTGYVLLAIVLFSCLYAVFSPKNPWVSAVRVLAPWSDLPPPTSVKIESVRPGHVELQRGERLEVMCEVQGLAADQPLQLVYQYRENDRAERSITLQPDADHRLFRGWLPSTESGLFEDLDYWVRGGDARSPTYRAAVISRPTLRVTQLRYHYPAYTGFATREVRDSGDIRALEGTRVQLLAEANYPIQAATLDIGMDATADLKLRPQGQSASVEWVLSRDPAATDVDRRRYGLRYTTSSGLSNRDPVESTLQIDRDWPPEVEILAPVAEELELAVDEAVQLEIRALDPDFALSRVSLQGEAAGREPLELELLSAKHAGQWVHQRKFVPSQYGLQPGDLWEFWVVAQDNKQPQPGVSETPRQRLRIMPASQGDNGSGAENSATESDEPSPAVPEDAADGSSEQGQGEQGQGEQGQGEQGQGEQGQGEQGQGEQGQGEQGQGEQGQGEQGQGEQGQGEQGQGEQGQGEQGQGEQGQGEQGQGGQGQGTDGGEGQDGPPGASGERTGEGAEGESGTDSGPTDGGKSAVGERGDSRRDPDDSGVGEGAEPVRDLETDGTDDAAALQELLQDPQLRERLQELAEQESSGDSSGSSEGAAAESDGGGQDESSGPSDQPGESPEGPGAPATDQEDKLPGETPPSGGESQSPESPASPDQSQGESGSGQGDGSLDAGPRPEQDQKPHSDKHGSQEPEQAGEAPPPSPARDARESNAVGEAGGDRTGEGESGGGQQANRDGIGSPGQHTAADEGEGISNEVGGDGPATDQTGGTVPGESTSESAGDADASGNSADATSDPADEADAESTTPTDGPTGQGTAAGPGDSAPSEEGVPSEDNAPTQEGGATGNSAGAPGSAAPPAAAGERTSGEGTGDSRPEARPADEVNQEFAQQATDLVLEHLQDQLEADQLDQQRLDRWDWSEHDLRALLDRWQSLRDAAETGDRAAEQELSQALRSLGLTRDRFHRADSRQADGQQQLRGGHRVQPPQEYAEQFRAFQRSSGK